VTSATNVCSLEDYQRLWTRTVEEEGGWWGRRGGWMSPTSAKTCTRVFSGIQLCWSLLLYQLGLFLSGKALTLWPLHQSTYTAAFVNINLRLASLMASPLQQRLGCRIRPQLYVVWWNTRHSVGSAREVHCDSSARSVHSLRSVKALP